jgi:hypothetical protein
MNTHFNPLKEAFAGNSLKDSVSIPCKNKGESGKAICIIPEYLDSYENIEQVQVWIPISQVSEIHPDHVVIQRWIADKKGLLP